MRWKMEKKVEIQKVIKNIVVGVFKMNNKIKGSSKRKESGSKQHTSNLRSSSKSSQKSKHRSDSKLRFKLKTQDISRLETSQDHPYPNPSRPHTKKPVPNNTTSDEYYNHYRIKSKSKGKMIPLQEENLKHNYINSVYMHKQSVNQSSSHHEHLVKTANQSARNIEKEESVHTSAHVFNKIKLIEKNGAIDANGKFVMKEVKVHETLKHADSMQTISIYETQRKKERLRKKQKTRKQVVKTKKREVGQVSRLTEGSRLAGIRSADKFTKKKQVNEIISPCVPRGSDPQIITQVKDGANKQIKKNPPILSSRTSKTILSEETQTSPQQAADYQANLSCMQVQLQEVIKQLSQAKIKAVHVQKLKVVCAGRVWIERIKCIQFLSKICVSLSIRREAHSLAILYMDNYLILAGIDAVKQLKFVALTSLLLALKVDDGIMSRRLCHQLITRIDIILGLSNRSSSKSKSIMKYKQAISALSSRDNSTILNKSKSQSNISDLAGSRTDETKRSRKEEYSREMGCILALQLDMLLRFSFKIVKKSSTYWADLLTLLWDSYITEEVTWEEELLFRSSKNKRNLSQLYQIIERASLELDHYLFSTPLLVLSIIYLIVRMRLEQQKEGFSQKDIYSKYAASLSKSTNLIFYDNVGVNELFGDFLYEIQLTLSQIVDCIQWIGSKAILFPFKTFLYNSKNQFINSKAYEHFLSIYEPNPDIYKFIEDQY